jgi:hypothetical protein
MRQLRRNATAFWVAEGLGVKRPVHQGNLAHRDLDPRVACNRVPVEQRDDVEGAWWKSFFLGFFTLIPLGWLLRAVGIEAPPESAYVAVPAVWLAMWLVLRRSSGRTAVVLDSI